VHNGVIFARPGLLLTGASWLPDSWKERLQLHCQTDVPADLESSRHRNGCSTQVSSEDLHAIFSCHREHDVRGRMHSLNDMTGLLADRENVLPALRSAQVELVDCVEIFGGI
jgi:hypothetical protein